MNGKYDLWYGYHNVSECFYHVRITVKYRKCLLEKRVEQTILESMKGFKERYAIEIQRAGFDRDHVHILCRFLPKYSGGQVIRLLKSISSRHVFREVPEVKKSLWGGEVLFRDDGPPNSGTPVIKKFSDITALKKPDARGAEPLKKVYEALGALKSFNNGEAPIIGIVMSPFSLPVMQMGFENYLELIYEEPFLFERLMRTNEEFCVEWANAQLEAGADVIGYFDPVSSTTIIPPELYFKTGYKVAKRTLKRIKGTTATHFASGRALPVINRVIETGTAAIGISAHEDLAMVKAACKGRITAMGNLNGIEMRRWTLKEAEEKVKEAILKAGAGGGFILSDNHGEIPYQVPEEVLLAISEAVRRWGRYPLSWAARTA